MNVSTTQRLRDLWERPAGRPQLDTFLHPSLRPQSGPPSLPPSLPSFFTLRHIPAAKERDTVNSPSPHEREP